MSWEDILKVKDKTKRPWNTKEAFDRNNPKVVEAREEIKSLEEKLKDKNLSEDKKKELNRQLKLAQKVVGFPMINPEWRRPKLGLESKNPAYSNPSKNNINLDVQPPKKDKKDKKETKVESSKGGMTMEDLFSAQEQKDLEEGLSDIGDVLHDDIIKMFNARRKNFSVKYTENDLEESALYLSFIARSDINLVDDKLLQNKESSKYKEMQDKIKDIKNEYKKLEEELEDKKYKRKNLSKKIIQEKKKKEISLKRTKEAIENYENSIKDYGGKIEYSINGEVVDVVDRSTKSLTKGQLKMLDEIFSNVVYQIESDDVDTNRKNRQQDEDNFRKRRDGVLLILDKIDGSIQNWEFVEKFKSNKYLDTPNNALRTIKNMLLELSKDTNVPKSMINESLLIRMLTRWKNQKSGDISLIREAEKAGFFSPKTTEEYEQALYNGKRGNLEYRNNAFIRFQDGAKWDEKDETWIIQGRKTEENPDGKESGFRMYGTGLKKDARKLYEEIREHRNQPVNISGDFSDNSDKRGKAKKENEFSIFQEFFQNIKDAKEATTVEPNLEAEYNLTTEEGVDAHFNTDVDVFVKKFFKTLYPVLKSYRTLERIEQIDFTKIDEEDKATGKLTPKAKITREKHKEMIMDAQIYGEKTQEGLIEELEFLYQTLDLLGHSAVLSSKSSFKELQKWDFNKFDLFTTEEQRIIDEELYGKPQTAEVERTIKKYLQFDPNRKNSNLTKLYNEYKNRKEEYVEDETVTKSMKIAKALRRINRKKTMLEGLL